MYNSKSMNFKKTRLLA